MDDEQKIVLEELKKDPPTPIATYPTTYDPGANVARTGAVSGPGEWRHASWCNGSGYNCDRTYCYKIPGLPISQKALPPAGVNDPATPVAHPGIKHKAYVAHRDDYTRLYQCSIEGCLWTKLIHNSQMQPEHSVVIGDGVELVADKPTEISEFLSDLLRDMTQAANAAAHDKRHMIYWWIGEIRRRAIDAKLWKNPRV